MLGDTVYAYWLESIVVMMAMALVIFATLRWIASQDQLKQEIDPKTATLGPPNLCRGGWNEGTVRGCAGGYALTGIPVEPVNTYSNLAYVATGWVAVRAFGGGPATVFAIAMTFLCFGSALYHGVKSRWSARWDHGGMYAVMAGLAFYMMAVGHGWDWRIMLGGALVSGVALAWLLDGYLMARMGLLLALISVGVFTRGDGSLGRDSLIVFGVAMAAWLIDRYTNLLGRFGHGLWHVFTAAALTIMFGAVQSHAP